MVVPSVALAQEYAMPELLTLDQVGEPWKDDTSIPRGRCAWALADPKASANTVAIMVIRGSVEALRRWIICFIRVVLVFIFKAFQSLFDFWLRLIPDRGKS